MTDKAKASEHDLREGSKPRCPKCEGGNLDYKHYPVCDKVYCYRCGTWFEISSPDDFAQFFPIAAILEENQRLRKRAVPPKELPRYTDPPDICPTCDTRSFISDGPTHYVCYNCHNTKLLEEAEAENQRLAKELEKYKVDSEAADIYAAHLAESETAREAAEAKLGEMRETLQTIAGFAPGNGDVCEIIARRARAALAE